MATDGLLVKLKTKARSAKQKQVQRVQQPNDRQAVYKTIII